MPKIPEFTQNFRNKECQEKFLNILENFRILQNILQDSRLILNTEECSILEYSKTVQNIQENFHKF